jgi:membrane protein
LHAIFPAIAALVAIYGFFTDPASISSQVDKLSGVLPSGALDVIRNQMNLVACQGQTKLGVTVIVGFIISLWIANAGIKSIFDALNLVYNEGALAYAGNEGWMADGPREGQISSGRADQG